MRGKPRAEAGGALLGELRRARTVGIVRLGSIGDVIATLPFAELLRSLLPPPVRIVWIAHPGPAKLLEGVPALDEVVVLPRATVWSAVPRWRRRLRGAGIEAVVDLHGNSKSALVALLTGARVRIGYAQKDCRESLNLLGTNRKLPALTSGHKTRRAMEIAEFLGHPALDPTGQGLRFGLEFTQEELRRAQEVVDATERPGAPVTLVQLGRPEDIRGWPADHWVPLIHALSSSAGSVVVLAGPDEVATGREVQQGLGGSPPGVRFEIHTLSLREVGALCQRLASDPKGGHAFVGADSGCLHLASACGLPSVALFGPQDPQRTAPITPRTRVLYRPEVASCVPCSRRECFHSTHQACMRAISPEAVLREVRSIQGRPPTDGDSSESRPASGEPTAPSPTARPARSWLPALVGVLGLACILFLVGALRGGGLGEEELQSVERARQTWPVGSRIAPPVLPGDPTPDVRAGPVLLAASIHLVGDTPLGARLPSVLAAVLALFLTARLAGRLSSLSTGILATVCLLCMPGFVVAACRVGASTPAMAAVLLGVVVHAEADTRGRGFRRVGVPLAWLALALSASLAGPGVLVLVGLPLVLLARLERGSRSTGGSPVPGLLGVSLALGALGAWIAGVAHDGGLPFQQGLVDFLGGADSSGPARESGLRVLAPLPWLAVAGLPVTLLAPIALYAHLKIRRYREDLGFADRRFRLPKAIVILGIIVLALLPMDNGLTAPILLPFLALLVGSWLERALPALVRRQTERPKTGLPKTTRQV